MKNELHILVLDDDPDDVSLTAHALSQSDLAFNLVRVETEEGFLHQLEHGHPDVILSDHGLPSFDGLAALALAKSRSPETPFIMVCGRGRDATVTTALDQGATGCVPKDQLSALGVTIKHAVERAEERIRWKSVESDLRRHIQDLEEQLASIKTLTGFIHICANCKRMKDEEGQWTQLERFLEQHSEASLSHGICPDCAQQIYGDLVSVT